jgi:hypothetical protein
MQKEEMDRRRREVEERQKVERESRMQSSLLVRIHRTSIHVQ